MLLVVSLLDKLITLIKKQKYTPDEIILNVSVFIGMLIKTVENYSYLTTVEKKEIVKKLTIKMKYIKD